MKGEKGGDPRRLKKGLGGERKAGWGRMRESCGRKERLGETWSVLVIEGCGRAEEHSHRHTLTHSDRRFMSHWCRHFCKHSESFCKTVIVQFYKNCTITNLLCTTPLFTSRSIQLLNPLHPIYYRINYSQNA